jgi:hypothetical protein
VDVALTVILFMPWIAILWLANLAERRRGEGRVAAANGWAALALGSLILLYLLLLATGLMLFGVGLLAQGPLADAQVELPATGFDPQSLPQIGLGLWLPTLLGLILLLPPVRRLLSRLIPIDPASIVHAVALSYVSLLLINLLVTLGMGLNNLAEMLEQSSAAGVAFNPIPGLWAQDITWVVMALIGVGWLARRGLAAALERLAIVRPTLGQTALGVGAALLLIPIIVGLEFGFSRVGITTDASVERLAEQMLGPLLTSAGGILTLGLAAAIGEESIFRGALQPRFGLLFTAILFALTHSNYGLSLSSALVFLVGLVLGIIRQRTNTTTTMILHAVYNCGLGLLAMLGVLPDF